VTHPVKHPVLAALDAIDEALKSVADVNPTFMRTDDKAAAMVGINALSSRLAELQLRILADADDVAADTAARDAGGWLAHETRTGRADGQRDLSLATDLDRRWHLVATGLREGQVNLPQARVICRALDRLPKDVSAETVEKAEEILVAKASEFGPQELAKLGRRILDVAAPEVAEAVEAKRLAELENDAADGVVLHLHRRRDGKIAFSGVLDDVSGTRLGVFLEAYTNPRKHQNASGETEGEAGSLTNPKDPIERLPYGRRLGEAFCSFLEHVDPKRLPVHGGDSTTLLVTIDFESLKKELGTGEILTTAAIPGGEVDGCGATGDRITASQVRRLACNANILPVVLSGKSEILDLGRSRRLFSAAQRKALLLRDRTCRAEGCHIPGTWAEAHHWIPWERLGETNLRDAVLLCSHHHHRAHDDRFEAERLASGDVRFNRRR
jgi:hypothetical protein